MKLELVICWNSETLGADREMLAGERIEELAGNIHVQRESSFEFWNGGGGYKAGTGHVAVRLTGYGCLKDAAAARKAILFMLQDTEDDVWPSSSQVEAAFEARDEVADRLDKAITREQKRAEAEEESISKELAKEAEQ